MPGDAAVSWMDGQRRSILPVGSFDGSQELKSGHKGFRLFIVHKGRVISIPVHTQRDRELWSSNGNRLGRRERCSYAPGEGGLGNYSHTPSAIIATDIIGIISRTLHPITRGSAEWRCYSVMQRRVSRN